MHVKTSEEKVALATQMLKEAGWGWDLFHGAMDILGAVPIVGNVADVVNAGVYGARGKYGDAALSLAAAVPVVGYGATAAKGAKWTNKGYKAIKTTTKGAPKALTKNLNAKNFPTLKGVRNNASIKATQGVAEGLSKSPKIVNTAVKKMNKGLHGVGTTVSKTPFVGRFMKPGGALHQGVKGWVRWRGLEGGLAAGDEGNLPGFATANKGYNFVWDNTLGRAGEGIGQGIGTIMNQFSPSQGEQGNINTGTTGGPTSTIQKQLDEIEQSNQNQNLGPTQPQIVKNQKKDKKTETDYNKIDNQPLQNIINKNRSDIHNIINQ